ncbi:MAG: MmcQ/YjbR family DNA-binding protein, partial [Rikenellaceae bacterium]
MNIEEYREYCLSLPCVEETLPFDDVTLVYKIGGKVFT